MTLSAVRPGQTIPAAATGVYLGTGRTGPFSMRLFRPVPTRIVVLSGGFAAQLVTMRAALSGSPVRVMTGRASSWAPVLQHGADARLVPEDSPLLRQRGPMIVVDDQPERQRSLRDVADWQCLLDLRAVRSDRGESAKAHLAALAQSDAAILGACDHDLAAVVARAYGLDDTTTSTLAAGLPAQAVAVLARGRAEVVRVDATGDEAGVLRSAVFH